jgi:signal transduction histidine kinase
MGATAAARWRRSAAGYIAAFVITAMLAVLAAQADSAAPHATFWLVTTDVVVGLAFVAAAALASGRLGQRGLVAAVGPLWLAGSVLPATAPLHQGVLAGALVAFPAGRVRGRARWLLIGLAVPVGLGWVPQVGVSVLFYGIAGVSLVGTGGDRVAARYPAIAGTAIGTVLGLSWYLTSVRAEALDPTLALLGYELVLLLVAVTFPLESRAVLRSRERLADRLLSGERFDGLDEFAAVLGAALGDRELRVYRSAGPDAGYVDGDGHRVPVGTDRRWLMVADRGKPIAAVAHRCAALDDAPTAAAVSSAVGLAVTHIGLQEVQRQRLRDLEASRARIVAAADRQRERAAAELRMHVEASLQMARSELGAVRPAVDAPEAGAALDVVVQELAVASREIADLIFGIPPADLGDGRLRQALEGVAVACPLPVTVAVAGEAAADREAETALFYVACEALANAIKHARATRVTITVRRVDGGIAAIISDDGRGGADPDGSGIQGLADRAASRGGRLRVDSPPGAGTTMTAFIPT